MTDVSEVIKRFNAAFTTHRRPSGAGSPDSGTQSSWVRSSSNVQSCSRRPLAVPQRFHDLTITDASREAVDA